MIGVICEAIDLISCWVWVDIVGDVASGRDPQSPVTSVTGGLRTAVAVGTRGRSTG